MNVGKADAGMIVDGEEVFQSRHYPRE